MKFTVKDPDSGETMMFEARPEQFRHEQGYRINNSNGSGFFLSNKLGTWRVLDGHHIDPRLLVQIGIAIEHLEK